MHDLKRVFPEKAPSFAFYVIFPVQSVKTPANQACFTLSHTHGICIILPEKYSKSQCDSAIDR